MSTCGFGDLGLGEQHDDWGVERPAKRAKLCFNRSDVLLNYPAHDYQNYSWSNSEFQGSAVNHQSLLVEDGFVDGIEPCAPFPENFGDPSNFSSLETISPYLQQVPTFGEDFSLGGDQVFGEPNGPDCVRQEDPDQRSSSKGNNDPFVQEQPNEYQVLRPRPEICYGMIKKAAVSNSRDVTQLLDGEANSTEVFLSGSGGLITIHSRSGAYCGLLCTHITRALTQIAQKCPLRFEAFVSSEDKEKANSKLSISINIYGLLEDSETIGDLLSDNEVFLQRPSKYDDSYEYRNPQYFTIPEAERMGIEIDTDLSHDSAAVLRHRWTNDVQDMLETLLPSASQTWPQGCVVSNRLKTPMLEHQQQALCFMREREEVHCHINSNHHRRNCLGGILADQMGLGKSLTALALVAGSIPEEDIRDGPYDTRQTLIVIPASTMSTWLEQIQVHMVPDCLKTLVYHGSRRKSAFAEMKSPHVVLTTYTTLVSDWQSKNSPLYEKEWFRVIIDEAHFIKDRTTKRFQAVCSLKGERRWCLTGTPIQNCIDDLSALLIFIRSAPFDNHREFQTQVITPLKNCDSRGLLTLRSALRAAMLRRTKQVLHLPPREDLELELALSQNERELYEIARDETEFIIEGCLESSDFSKGFSIIQSILRQRQICNHGADLLPQGVRSRLLRRHRFKTWSKESPPEDGYPTFCEACNLEMAQDECEVPFEFCLHLVCSKCLQGQSAENDVGNLCPICNEMESGSTKRESSFRAWVNELDYSGPSAKVRALLENIQQLNKEDSTAKSVVFSSWVRMLYLIEVALGKAGISCVRLVGTMQADDRKEILENFRNNSSTKVLLISIGAGSVGINLTAASYVHLMEPQWNPMVENQALDRVHRLGQTKPVKTFRYIAQGTFDQAILELQRKKIDLADLSLGSGESTRAEQMRTRLESLRAVFR